MYLFCRRQQTRISVSFGGEGGLSRSLFIDGARLKSFLLLWLKKSCPCLPESPSTRNVASNLKDMIWSATEAQNKRQAEREGNLPSFIHSFSTQISLQTSPPPLFDPSPPSA